MKEKDLHTQTQDSRFKSLYFHLYVRVWMMGPFVMYRLSAVRDFDVWNISNLNSNITGTNAEVRKPLAWIRSVPSLCFSLDGL